ncbi:DNA-directed RNA polymerase sigma-70 factor [Streptomyces sp. ZAF1911]|nr:DNA-directed RNA polymerase sigma-70 factor [Streptomyces sp. ZAF1911]MDD9378352.1 DNA-directed RNA polymerase sigma-70 factor [Streptomyces sp. ZAF1911]
MPRHEAKSPVKAGPPRRPRRRRPRSPAPRQPPPPGTGTDTGPDGGSDPRAHSAPSPASPAGAGSEAATRTSGAGTGSGPDPASAAGKAAGPDAASASPADAAQDAAQDAEPDATPTGKATGPAEPEADPGTEARTAPQEAPAEDTAPTPSAIDAFEALYDRTAPALARQAYLLTGRHALACEAVERAFQQAWERWPEVATDPDPVGWVRAAAYEHALSPWHRFRRAHRHPDEPPADPADRVLLDAMLALPPAHRRTVLLYDGVGLDLPDTAAETEASTPTAGNRLVNAHADLADQLPELDGVPPAKQSAVLRERLGTLRPAGRLEPRPAAVVRVAGEHRNRLWTRAVVGVTAVITAATAYTWVTAPTEYEPPRAPGASVSGVPPHSGPQQLTDEGRQLHDKLLSDPSAGPSRISPSLE